MRIPDGPPRPPTGLEDLRALYPAVRSHIRRHLPDHWPALRDSLSGMTESLPALAILPLASAAAVGGDPRHAVPVTAAWMVFNVAYRLLDDLQDQDRPRGHWAELGVSRASNVASGLLVLGHRLLADSPRLRSVLAVLDDEAVRIASGQDRDLLGQTRTLEDYWRTIEDKNGRIYAVACACGALAARDDAGLATACHQFGFHLGLGLQALDDLQGIWEPEGAGDLALGKVTLPLLYALQHAEDEPRRELEGYVARGALAEHAERVREILDAARARPFLVWTAVKERDLALEALERCPGAVGTAALRHFAALFFTDLDGLAGAPVDEAG